MKVTALNEDVYLSGSKMKLSDKLDNAWKLLGTTSSNSKITFPSSYNEILGIVAIQNNINVKLSILIPYPFLSGTEQGFNSGYLRSTDINCLGRIIATNTQGYLTQAFLNNSNVLSSSKTYWYYR